MNPLPEFAAFLPNILMSLSSLYRLVILGVNGDGRAQDRRDAPPERKSARTPPGFSLFLRFGEAFERADKVAIADFISISLEFKSEQAQWRREYASIGHHHAPRVQAR